jgi:hypothetical protein
MKFYNEIMILELTKYLWKKTASVIAEIYDSGAPTDMPLQIIPAPRERAIITGRVYTCV